MRNLTLFSLFISLHFIGNAQYHRPLKIEEISLIDKQTYPIYESWVNDIISRNNHAPYNWEIDLDTTTYQTTNSTPIIIRTLESSDYSFTNFKELIINKFNETSFPINYERYGISGYRKNGIYISVLDEGFCNFFNIIMNESKARREMFIYFININLLLQQLE